MKRTKRPSRLLMWNLLSIGSSKLENSHLAQLSQNSGDVGVGRDLNYLFGGQHVTELHKAGLPFAVVSIQTSEWST